MKHMLSQSQSEEKPSPTPADTGYQQLIEEILLHDPSFIKATWSSPSKKQQTPWLKVVVRPVILRGDTHLQFSYFDAHKDITKNYAGDERIEPLHDLLACGFKQIYLYTQQQTIHVQITKKEKVLIHTTRPLPEQQQERDLSHDRSKKTLFAEAEATPFLQTVGMMGEDRKIKADMYGKFRQIHEFVKLVQQTGALEHFTASPLHVVDAGCGNAYLTFAFYYYLHQHLKKPVSLIGIDSRSEPLERHREKVAQLQWEDLTFQHTTIIDFQPRIQPDIVLSLHACDTATDEALAQGIRWGSRLLVSVPCCHHHLQQQIERQASPAPFGPVLRQSILKERLGDILTDSFRMLILQIMGYRTDIVQFISSEHTAKNLMIRAVKTQPTGNARYVQEYQDLKEFWQVTPYLESLLGEDFRRMLAVSPV
ncbi:MAG: SAM-dependent methyltransferase [Ktedonobacteraceae bacterium]